MKYQLPEPRKMPTPHAVIEAVSPLVLRELREGLNTGRAGLLQYAHFEEYVEGLSYAELGPGDVINEIGDLMRRFRAHRARRMRDESCRSSKPKSPGNISKETCVAGAYFERQLFLAILQDQIPQVLELYDALVELDRGSLPADLAAEVEVYRNVVQNGGVGLLQEHFDQLAETHAETFRKTILEKKLAEGQGEPARLRNNAASRKSDTKKAYLVSLTKAQASHLLEVRQQLRAIWMVAGAPPTRPSYPNSRAAAVIHDCDDEDEDEVEDEVVHEDIDENEDVIAGGRGQADGDCPDENDKDFVEESESEWDVDNFDEYGEDGACVPPAPQAMCDTIALDDDIHGENASSCSTFGQRGNSLLVSKGMFESSSPATIEELSHLQKSSHSPIRVPAMHGSSLTPVATSESRHPNLSSCGDAGLEKGACREMLAGRAQPLFYLIGMLSVVYIFAVCVRGFVTHLPAGPNMPEYLGVDL